MPVSEESDSSGAVYSLPPGSEASNSTEPTLSDLSPRDKPWDKHRGFADRVESYYVESEFHRLGERIHSCSELLQFGLAVADSDSLKLKLRTARFGRVRHCPVCQWRRSLSLLNHFWKSKLIKKPEACIRLES
jgi:hypothetical protein